MGVDITINIKNDGDQPFWVTEHDGRYMLYDDTITDRGVVPAHQTVLKCVTVSRSQGSDADGKAGFFALRPALADAPFLSMRQFEMSNDGELSFNTQFARPGYDDSLSAMLPDGSYTWTVHISGVTFRQGIDLLTTFFATGPDKDSSDAALTQAPALEDPLETSGRKNRQSLYLALKHSTGAFAFRPDPKNTAPLNQVDLTRLNDGGKAATHLDAASLGLDAANLDMAKVNEALVEKFGTSSADFMGSMPIYDSSWYRWAMFKNDQKAQQATAPSSWTMDDTLSSLATLSFAIPEIGAVLGAGVGVLQRLFDNSDAQKAWRASQHPDGTAPPDPLDVAVGELKRAILDQTIAARLDALVADTRLLKSSLARIVNDKTDGSGFFRDAWLTANDARQTRYAALADEELGRVFTILADHDFSMLVAPTDAVMGGYGSSATVDDQLIEAPTQAMLTLSAYDKIMTVVVQTRLLYGYICLFPDEAYQPGWDIGKFDLDKALGSNLWKVDDPKLKKQARECWLELINDLDPDPTIECNYMTRLHPDTGDAAAAFRLIKARLDRISFEGDLPQTRATGHTFLLVVALETEMARLQTTIGYFREYEQNVYTYRLFNPYVDTRGTMELSVVSWGEIRDTSLLVPSGDDFIKSFRDFGEKPAEFSQVCWRPDLWEALSGPIHGAVTAISNRPRVQRLDPYGNPVTAADRADPQSAHFMSGDLGRDAVAWFAFVFSNYASRLNYKIEPATGNSLYTEALLLHKGWTSIHDFLKPKFKAPIGATSGNPVTAAHN